MRSRPTTPAPTSSCNTGVSRSRRCAPSSTARCSRAAPRTSRTRRSSSGAPTSPRAKPCSRRSAAPSSALCAPRSCSMRTAATPPLRRPSSRSCPTVPVAGAKVVVLAGTGPVGQRAAALFSKEGAEVVLTSRTLARAEAACAAIAERFGESVTPAAAADETATRSVLEGAAAVLCTGVTGVTLIPEAMWRGHETLRVLGDVNAVPPLGLEATKATWDGKDVDGKIVFGALAIGDLKMKVHKRSIARLFEQNDLVLDAEEIFALRQGAGRVVRVLVLGVSTRAMVESAVRGGHDVVAVDFFGDRDQARARGELRAAARSRPAGDRGGIGGGGAAHRRRRRRLRLEPREPPRGGRRARPPTAPAGKSGRGAPRGARLGAPAALLPGGRDRAPVDPAPRRGGRAGRGRWLRKRVRSGGGHGVQRWDGRALDAAPSAAGRESTVARPRSPSWPTAGGAASSV